MPYGLLFGFYMASDTGSGSDVGRAILGFLMSIVANALLYLHSGLLGVIHLSSALLLGESKDGRVTKLSSGGLAQPLRRF